MSIPQLKRLVAPGPARSRLLALAVLGSVSCAEPTGPAARDQSIALAVEPAAAGTRTATIRRLVLSSKTIILDATPVPYAVTIRNPNRTEMTEVFLQGEIVQAGGYRGAGGFNVDCGAGQAVLPAGTCTLDFTVGTSNGSAGEGTLVPGPAEFVLTLYQGFATPVPQDVQRVRVTLVNP